MYIIHWIGPIVESWHWLLDYHDFTKLPDFMDSQLWEHIKLGGVFFFYLILNRTLILNSVKYEVVCFFNILFVLSIKK